MVGGVPMAGGREGANGRDVRERSRECVGAKGGAGGDGRNVEE